MLSTLVLAFVGLLPWVRAFSLYPDTGVVIVSNNDLNPSNPNRASALYLKSAYTCMGAYQACAQLQETLLPPPNGTGLTAANLSTALTSGTHGLAIDSSQRIWIAGAAPYECAVFSPGGSTESSSGSGSGSGVTADVNEELPVLCSNTAPPMAVNSTLQDSSHQIQLSTNTAGTLIGFRDKFSFKFLGVKYAESTAGLSRFQPPTSLRLSNNVVRTAFEYGPICAQPPDADNGHLLYSGEDCLQLNIFTPVVNTGSNAGAGSSKLPVMFYIHGGGLNTGDSGPFPFNMTTEGYVGPTISNMLDGTNVASYGGAVVVTINYRLNALGWFNASNAALKDALLALHWVQDNIEAFGGDPTRVLIYGESAGGTMVRYLLGTNPKYTEGLFSAAILESDFGQSTPFTSPSYVVNTSLTLAENLGCAANGTTTLTSSVISCMQSLPAESLSLASYNLGLTWNIVIDGDYVLTDIASSIEDGVYARVPTIWSSNQCEYCYFLPTTIAPNSPPQIFTDSLGLWFNQTQVATLLNTSSLTENYPYETATGEDGISGAVLQLGQLMTDWDVHCPMVYLSSLETNTTNRNNSYKVEFGVGLGSPLTPNPATCPGQGRREQMDEPC
ncbi:alpha/beta-hydrolase [Gloeophyllum trabeum ATCC 11539]|uniref:Carboxylic ester hydrolase n=1 Tax=Gloeophyllum trabeum (strain ATCC 11539 / FP-39264 / Madison 617) TaxID=670483 RepID=S7REV3_GLOTA|nr:alpha/beta-hydrolase [Gloeophyllum trabeum ATCC 11539]EPQ50984.1 alpha/beta-hydrolase [Gloeophyllum trabeum ATCC 11539]